MAFFDVGVVGVLLQVLERALDVPQLGDDRPRILTGVLDVLHLAGNRRSRIGTVECALEGAAAGQTGGDQHGRGESGDELHGTPIA